MREGRGAKVEFGSRRNDTQRGRLENQDAEEEAEEGGTERRGRRGGGRRGGGRKGEGGKHRDGGRIEWRTRDVEGGAEGGAASGERIE